MAPIIDATTGKAGGCAACFACLRDEGPRWGYFIEEDKSFYLCKAEDKAVARTAFAAKGFTKVKFCRGHRYLGGYLGAKEEVDAYLKEKVETWVEAVKTMAHIADLFPQAVYAIFAFCLQDEWQYVQRVITDTGQYFALLEEVI